MDLHLTASTIGRYVVVTARGELDVAAAPTLAAYLTAVLDQQRGREVILDVRGVSFLDAAGLSGLLAAEREAERRGGCLRLAGPPRQLRMMLSITGLTGRLDIYPSTYAAAVWPHVPVAISDPAPAAGPGPLDLPLPSAAQAHELIWPGA
jgi:anti-sigma B factor antagonist